MCVVLEARFRVQQGFHSIFDGTLYTEPGLRFKSMNHACNSTLNSTGNTSALFVLKHGSYFTKHRSLPLTTSPSQNFDNKLQSRRPARTVVTMVNTGRLPALMLLLVAPCASFLCSGPSVTSLPLRCSSSSSASSFRLRPRSSHVPHCAIGGAARTQGPFSLNGSDRCVLMICLEYQV